MRGSLSGRGLCSITILAMLTLAGCGDEEPAQSQNREQQPPTSAQVMEVAPQDLELDKTYSALLRSDNAVTLVARVTGTLEARHFEAGELVEQGESLYTIEPDIYRATVRQREADLQSAQAELYRAQRDWERFERLYQQNSVSQQQRDQALAALKVAEAQVAQAEAALDDARIDLNYTTVEAPVTGQVSLSQVNVGNLVSTGTELATITPLDPLEVRFQIPQEDAFELRRQRREEGAEITAVLEFPALHGAAVPRLEGQLDFLGSQVSEATSTVQANAHFDNPNGLFLPGQFVRVRLEGLKRFEVLAVPEIAVTQGLMGPQVYALDDNDTARARTITLGETAGPWFIVREGLEPGDRVAVSGIGSIKPGTVIEPQPFDGNAEALVERAVQAETAEQAEAQEPAAQAQSAQETAEAQGEGSE